MTEEETYTISYKISEIPRIVEELSTIYENSTGLCMPGPLTLRGEDAKRFDEYLKRPELTPGEIELRNGVQELYKINYLRAKEKIRTTLNMDSISDKTVTKLIDIIEENPLEPKWIKNLTRNKPNEQHTKS